VVETIDSSFCRFVDWLAHLLGTSRLHQFCSRMNIEELNRTFPEKEWSGEDFPTRTMADNGVSQTEQQFLRLNENVPFFCELL
jgi:hypothetical protein